MTVERHLRGFREYHREFSRRYPKAGVMFEQMSAGLKETIRANGLDPEDDRVIQAIALGAALVSGMADTEMPELLDMSPEHCLLTILSATSDIGDMKDAVDWSGLEGLGQ